MIRLSFIMTLVVMLPACTGYDIKNVAKSDVDLVADEFIDETRRLVRELTIKLYRRNPAELRKNPGFTIESRLVQLTSNPRELRFNELGSREGIEALELVFDEGYRGDRVFALVVGLGGMLRQAYGYNREMFMYDRLNPEALWTSAANVETLVWRLKNNRNSRGELFLITSEYRGVIDNLSFERLFGKIIVLQEMMARIAGDADDRAVTKAIHTASSVFIPLPI